MVLDSGIVLGATRYRAVLDCLATQDNPMSPKCAGCAHDYLCSRIRTILIEDHKARERVTRKLLGDRRT